MIRGAVWRKSDCVADSRGPARRSAAVRWMATNSGKRVLVSEAGTDRGDFCAFIRQRGIRSWARVRRCKQEHRSKVLQIFEERSSISLRIGPVATNREMQSQLPCCEARPTLPPTGHPGACRPAFRLRPTGGPTPPASPTSAPPTATAERIGRVRAPSSVLHGAAFATAEYNGIPLWSSPTHREMSPHLGC